MAEVNRKVFDIFGSMFLLSQKLQYVTDYELGKHGLTTKQFLILAAVDKGFDNAPTINEVASVLSTSHQNVKQLAKQLEKKGFIQFENDPNDRRKLLLKTTRMNRDFWDNHTEEHLDFFRQLFGDLSTGEVDQLYRLLNKLMSNFDSFYYKIRPEK